MNLVLGISLMAIGALGLIAIISYNALDKSLNTVSDAPPENILGIPGSYASDIMVQFFGILSIVVPATFVIFGFYKIIKKLKAPWIKLVLILVGLFFLSSLFEKLYKAGGVLGSLALSEIESIIYKISLEVNVNLLESNIFIYVFFTLIGVLSSLLITYGLLPSTSPDYSNYSMGAKEIIEEIPEKVTKIKKKKRTIFQPIIKKEKKVNKTVAEKSLQDHEVANGYVLPGLDLLSEVPSERKESKVSDKQINQNRDLLTTTLNDFGINGKIISVNPGPFVILYELEPAPGVKSSRVISLADDISRSMSSTSARIAVIPGKNSIGIELPNYNKETVYLREILESDIFVSKDDGIPLSLGKNIGGEPTIADLSRMPHLMIAGTTGSGKSVGINGMILSILYRFRPDECRLIMVDPKMIELSVYDGIPHLLSPVITNPKKAVVGLKWVVREMDDRYNRMSKLSVRTMEAFNEKAEEYRRKGKKFKRKIHTGYDDETGQPLYSEEEIEAKRMPFIVVVIDEMADLMLVARNDIEHLVQSLAQKARAAGIHLIMATQRPSVDVVTGTIKANFPTRIAFQVASKIDSRTILNEMGAEQLLGRGDMLYMSDGGKVVRVHGPFVSDDEVERVVGFIRKQETPEYIESITKEDGDGGNTLSPQDDSEDALFSQAVSIIIKDKRVSTSYIQRKLQIGYNRAARIIEEMEEKGIISEPNSQGKREIIGQDN
ncbi:DNA translocase FtsK 4TM domain-containing protein [Rhodobiaceae bacterium]|nr:DNA translocase FtsK 4TM domain-containing protein [Rhodobiaceae bacterium]